MYFSFACVCTDHESVRPGCVQIVAASRGESGFNTIFFFFFFYPFVVKAELNLSSLSCSWSFSVGNRMAVKFLMGKTEFFLSTIRTAVPLGMHLCCLHLKTRLIRH